MKGQLSDQRKRLLTSLAQFPEGPMIFLAFVWLILLIAEFVWGLSKELEYLSLTIWGVSILDFLLKLALATSKKHFFM